MMKKISILLFVITVLLNSCLHVREVKYLQPNENLVLNSEGLISYESIPKYRVNKTDILTLNIITTPKGDAAQFYSNLYVQQGATSTGGVSFSISSLKLDENGEINVFGMGNIKAEGKTTDEIAAEIQEKVNYNFLPGKSEVRVNIDGIRYTFLYDLEGRSLQKTANRANINIHEAIAENGGLDRAVDRKNVIIYRRFPEGIKKAQIDLTREDIMNSQYFWIQNGDLIMFNTKPKNFYGFGKEPIQTLTTGVSLLTTAISIYLLITK